MIVTQLKLEKLSFGIERQSTTCTLSAHCLNSFCEHFGRRISDIWEKMYNIIEEEVVLGPAVTFLNNIRAGRFFGAPGGSWALDTQLITNCRRSSSKWRFPEIGVPPVIIHFNRIPYKPSLFGYPHLWKPQMCFQSKEWFVLDHRLHLYKSRAAQ